MRKLLLILALLFAGCREEIIVKECPSCFSMQLSDALPVQFWLNNCETYNEKVVCGINHHCFCQPVECDDQIKIQFTDSFTDYVTEEVVTPITLPSLSTWLTTTLLTSWFDWSLGSTPSVSISYTTLTNNYSEYLYVDYPFEAGKPYSLTFNFTRTEYTGFGNPSVTIYTLDSGNNPVSSQQFLITSTGANSRTYNFVATEAMTRIGFRTASFASNYDMTVTSVSGTRTDTIITFPDPKDFDLLVYNELDSVVATLPFGSYLQGDSFRYVYRLDFIPSDLGICNEKMRLEIVEGETVHAKSDCIEVGENLDCTNIVTYSNNRDYAGLIYDDVSPEQEFTIRVPSRFFHERNDEEDEVMQLSSSLITTASTIQAQKLFEVIHAPYYWHRKLQLILKHSNVVIDNQYWLKQEGYQINEGNKRGSLKSAQVWLTQRENLQRNVI